MTRWLFKLAACCVGLAITLWGFSEDISYKNKKNIESISEVKVQELRKEVLGFRKERNLKISSLDKELKTEISGLKTQMKEANELLRVLVRRSNKEYVLKQEIQANFKENI